MAFVFFVSLMIILSQIFSSPTFNDNATAITLNSLSDVTCPKLTYPEKGNCWKCLCFNNKTCSSSTKCDCSQLNLLKGLFCQINQQDKQSTHIIKSESNNPILSEATSFSFNPITSGKYSIKWQVNVSNSSCYNSLTEEVLVIRKNCFNDQQNNTIKLTINSTQTSDVLSDSITIEINSRHYKGDALFSITEPPEPEMIKPRETMTTIAIDYTKPEPKDRLYYALSYKDRYENELFITSFDETTKITTTLPYLTKLYLNVKNDRGEKTVVYHQTISRMATEGYSTAINDILKDETTNRVKVKKLMNYCLFGSTLFSQEQLNAVASLVNKITKEIIKGTNPTTDEYFDMDHLFSFINYLINYHNDKTKIASDCNFQCALHVIEDILFQLAGTINNKPNYSISLESLKSLFRNIDSIVLFDTDLQFIGKYHQLLKDTLSNLREIISRKLFQGEQLHLKGHRVSMFFDRLGINQVSFSIPSLSFIDETYKLTDYIVEYRNKSVRCQMDKSFICMMESDYKSLKSEIELVKNVPFKDVVIGVIDLLFERVEAIPQYASLTKHDVIVKVYTIELGTVEVKSLRYRVSFPLKSKELISSSEKRSSVACMSAQSYPIQIVSNDSMCQTFFTESSVLCKCNVSDYITVVSNIKYAEASKELQFLLPRVDYLNIFSIPLIYSSAFLIVISSIVLLFYDIHKDKKNETIRQLSEYNLRLFIFKELNHLKSANVFFFALCMTYYQYPFIDVFSLYSHQNPRLIRFFKEIVIMLLSLILCLLPFYFSEFTQKKTFIDNRDFSQSHIKVDNLDADYWTINKIFWISFGVSVLVRIGSYLSFSSVINHAHMKQLIWNPIKNKFKEYIYNDIKKDILLNDNWHKIKIRILAVNGLCGRHIRRTAHDKTSRYLQYKRENDIKCEAVKQLVDYSQGNKALTNDNISNTSFEIDSSSCKQFNKSVDVFPLFPYGESYKAENHLGLIRNPLALNRDLDYRIQLKYSFSLSKNQHNSISKHTALRFKNIAARYFYKPNQTLNLTVDSYRDSLSIDNEVYFIEKQLSYSYLSGYQREKEDSLIKTKKILRKTLIAMGVLTLILLFVYGLICFLLEKAFREYRFYLIKAWLLPCLTQIIVFGFIMHYLMSLIAAVLLFKLREKQKTNRLIKLLYKLFVEKYMIDMFKLRNIIIKYNKEFEEEK